MVVLKLQKKTSLSTFLVNFGVACLRNQPTVFVIDSGKNEKITPGAKLLVHVNPAVETVKVACLFSHRKHHIYYFWHGATQEFADLLTSNKRIKLALSMAKAIVRIYSNKETAIALIGWKSWTETLERLEIKT